MDNPVEIQEHKGPIRRLSETTAVRSSFRARIHFVGGKLRELAQYEIENRGTWPERQLPSDDLHDALKATGAEPSEIMELTDWRTWPTAPFYGPNGAYVGPGGVTGEGGLLVTLEIEISIENEPLCHGLAIQPEPPSREPVSTLSARVPVQRLMKLAVAKATTVIGPPNEAGDRYLIHGAEEPMDAFIREHQEGKRGPQRGSPLTTRDLQRTALIYQNALKTKRWRHAPRKAVAKAEGISPAQASRRIKAARDDGLLRD